MKKILILLLALALVLPLAACGPDAEDPGTDPGNDPGEDPGTETEGYELALVTDKGTIDDKSFNQGAWEGLKQYAEEKDITYKYYQPAEQTDSAYLDSISLAVEGGAKLVVCPGFLFEPAVYQAQDLYPDTKFIILDGYPHAGDFVPAVNDNVWAVLYAEEQVGFLAGYAAVKEGYTKLGFMGGMAVPAVIRYGYGFIQGAEYAAEEMGLDSVELMYHYTGDFIASPEVQSMAASWNNSGTEVIFAAGGAVGNSVMAAAEEAGTAVIGVDVDQYAESDTVITSALKMLSLSVYTGISDYYAGSFPGGEVATLDATNDGVGLAWDHAKFETFTQDDYDAIFAQLVAGSIAIVRDADASGNSVAVSDIPVEIVDVTFVD